MGKYFNLKVLCASVLSFFAVNYLAGVLIFGSEARFPSGAIDWGFAFRAYLNPLYSWDSGSNIGKFCLLIVFLTALVASVYGGHSKWLAAFGAVVAIGLLTLADSSKSAGLYTFHDFLFFASYHLLYLVVLVCGTIAAADLVKRWPEPAVTNRSKRQSAAFTLVELLLVIAIIAILAGILVPSLLQSKKSARTISDVEEMRQLYIGLQLYSQDSNSMPLDLTLVRPYVRSTQVFASYLDKRDVGIGNYPPDPFAYPKFPKVDCGQSGCVNFMNSYSYAQSWASEWSNPESALAQLGFTWPGYLDNSSCGLISDAWGLQWKGAGMAYGQLGGGNIKDISVGGSLISKNPGPLNGATFEGLFLDGDAPSQWTCSGEKLSFAN